MAAGCRTNVIRKRRCRCTPGAGRDVCGSHSWVMPIQSYGRVTPSRMKSVRDDMSASKLLLVTGGAGFIGSNFVLEAMRRGYGVVNLDALTYAGNLDNLAALKGNAGHAFVHGSILDAGLVAKLLAERRPDAVVHFAAETVSYTHLTLPTIYSV